MSFSNKIKQEIVDCQKFYSKRNADGHKSARGKLGASGMMKEKQEG